MKSNKIFLFFLFSGLLIIMYVCKPEKEILVKTKDVNNITATTADVGGEILDLGNGVTKYGHCYGKAANTTVSGSKTEISVPASVGGFTSNLTGLEPGTKYYVKAYCSRGTVVVYGSEISFSTTSATLPVISTAAATSVTKTSATLNGSVNANGLSTVVTFEYGTTTSYGSTATASQSPVSGTANTVVSANITGLTEGTTYHFRVKAVNSAGTALGDDLTFTTLCNAATTATDPATNVASTSATLNGTINANNSSATVTFEYGTTTSYGSTVSATPGTVTGSTNTPVSAAVTGLTSNLLYHYRVKAISCGGTVNGNDQTFTPLCNAPAAATDVASNFGSTTATLNGTVNANGFSTVVTFEYGINTTYGNTLTATQSPVTGSSNTVVSAGATGLLPNTLYHYRVKAVSCGGTIYGNDLTFTLQCTAPVAATDGFTNLSATAATLNGTVNANGFSTTVTFEYGTNTSYGNTLSATQSPVTGSSNTVVSAGATSLQPNTLYHYRVKAVSCGGTIYGNDQTFTTLCLAPTAVTDAATNMGTTTATLNGTVNANGFSTAVTFEYGTTTSYGGTVGAAQSPVSGSSNTGVSAGATGLQPNTLYHYRVKAASCGGIVYGNDMTLSILQPPVVTTVAASSVQNTSVTLNGIVNANNSITTVTFEYGTSLSYGLLATAVQSPVSGNSPTSVSANVTGLLPGTTYHFRVHAASPGGSSDGIDLTFTTLQPPSSVTNAATNMTTTTATLNGIVNANNLSSIVTFDYGTTTGYGYSYPAVQSPVTGTSNNAVFFNASGLTPNTTYHFRVNAESQGGTTFGNDLTFTTLASVNTTPISNITASTATGGGSITFDGGATVTDRGLCWSTTTNPTLAGYNTFQGTGIGNFVSNITGLTENIQYYVRAFAINGGGTSYGNQVTFTTLRLPTAATSSPSSVSNTTATLNGSVNPNNSSTVVTFEYGTSITYGSEVPATPSPLTGGTAVSVTSGVTGLAQGITYHYRVKALSSAGTVYGSDQQFTTLQPPAATTTAATLITNITAQLNGTVNPLNSSTTVTFEYGTSLSYGSSVLANQSPVNGVTITNVSAGISGLIVGTTYHYRVKAVSAGGTTYGNDLIFKASFAIGQSYGGGIVFYVDGTGQHGLIASTYNQSTGTMWYNGTYTTTGATAVSIGSGQSNTTSIIASQGNTGSYAAKICQDLVIDIYNDWYLPSRDELNQLYINRAAVGGFSGNPYWCSTEYSTNQFALYQDFASGFQGNFYKYANCFVRAIRSF